MQGGLDIDMSSRVLWTVQWQSAGDGSSHEWVCTSQDLRRILVAVALAWAVLGVGGATWRGHRERMARIVLEEEWRENQILKQRQAALFERVFDLATRIDVEGARLGVRESGSMKSEAVQACWAARYAFDSAPSRLSTSGPSPLANLDCAALARGVRQRVGSQLRAAM